MTMRFRLSQSPSQARWQLQLKGLARRLLQGRKHAVGVTAACVCGNVLRLLRCVSSQCGQGVQGVKGSGVDRRDLVVVERQEAD